jgi:hypothetical protein
VGNARIVQVKLGYHAEEKILFKNPVGSTRP